MAQQFTVSQLSRLNSLFAEAGEGAIPGSWLADDAITADKIDTGAVTTDKIDSDAVITAAILDLAVTMPKLSAAVQGLINDGNTAYGWGERATEIAQGQTAYGWGDHATAGYLTNSVLKNEVATASGGGVVTLTGSPSGSTAANLFVVNVTTGAILTSADYTYAGGTSISGLTPGSDYQVVYVEVT